MDDRDFLRLKFLEFDCAMASTPLSLTGIYSIPLSLTEFFDLSNRGATLSRSPNTSIAWDSLPVKFPSTQIAFALIR